MDIRKLSNNHYRLNRIFIADAFQNKGLGSQIMQLIENEFPDAHSRSLDTPHLNTRNHHFYEKLGYVKIDEHKISDKVKL
ncbi:GNAT family N-acetyltransferase [Solibacillus palustris]|uniref:GNAT family N-acetyltransferase n=1 Tax=Solibacillus palustris TaxID=2908203 RepID=UPI0038CD927A